MEKTYKMTIDPSILELLGPSLYTNIYYVLAELIANAYDAQAKNVYIIAGRDLGGEPRSRDENMRYLGTLLEIRG